MSQRYYDASLGRWLSQDPIGFEGGLNLYAAMDNNPVTNVDPDGLETIGSEVAYGALEGLAGLGIGILIGGTAAYVLCASGKCR